MADLGRLVNNTEVDDGDEHREEHIDTEELVIVPPPPAPWVPSVDEDDDEGEESSKPRILSSPYAPSRQERAEHRITHCPFRSWCAECVAGKSKSAPHLRSGTTDKEEEDRLPTIGVDYAFMSEHSKKQENVGDLKVMVIRDEKSKYMFTIPVPQKGVDDQEYSVRRLIECLDFMGYTNFLVKIDQESSLAKVVEKVKAHLGSQVSIIEQLMVENSPVGDSQSNGSIERGIQTYEGQMRTNKIALEKCIGQKIAVNNNIIPWMAMHAGEIVSHHLIGKDGKVAFQRLRGRKMKRHLV